MHVRSRKVDVFVVEMYERLHLLGHSSHDEPFDCHLLLCSQPLLLSVVALPHCHEEVGESTQPLVLPLNLSLPFAKTMQSLDIRCDPCISYCVMFTCVRTALG